MRPWRTAVIVIIAAALLSSPPLWSWSGASGAHSVIALFESHVHPDVPFDHFAAGRLGIIKPTWGRSYLYVAYRYLIGPGFDPNEQKALVSYWNERLGLQLSPTETQWRDAGGGADAETSIDTGAGIADWISARSKVPGVEAKDDIDVYRKGVSSIAFNYPNCAANAFITAAHTLDTMIGKFGIASKQVKQWLDAQDQVFDNCSDSQSSPQIPAPRKDGTPFEQAQRAYQIACANFYSGNFDTAAKMFEAIAADPSSSWRELAPYLVARATIRKATLSSEKNDHALLAKAEAQLNQIVATSSDGSVRQAAQRLLGFVEAQLHPQHREQELAYAVMQTTSGEVLKQDVSDYIWMLNNSPKNDDVYSNDLTDWISTFSGLGQTDTDIASLLSHAIEKWKTTALLPWLVAAISTISPTDPNASALIKAAESVPPSSPAFATVTYHTARLLIAEGKRDEAREKLDAILARRNELPLSTVNEFAALRMSVARNLNELLTYAPRTPLGLTDDGDYEELPSQLDDPELKALAAGPLFDQDGAAVLTRWLPLSVLMEVVHSTTLPRPLRLQVLSAAWIRAVLLDNLPAARQLAPLMSESFPKLKPSINAWLAAKTPAARRFAFAIVLLQNPGLRFYLDPGPGRITPIDRIDSFRDNWWPSQVSLDLKTPQYPGFLSAAEKKSADEEWQELAAINAPNFLCKEAIGQAKSQPTDKRAPEALYLCLRAVHLGCSNSEGTELAHSAFILLHRRYPHSVWADLGTLWYKGDSCSSS